MKVPEARIERHEEQTGVGEGDKGGRNRGKGRKRRRFMRAEWQKQFHSQVVRSQLAL